jgi:hypothetical protein
MRKRWLIVAAVAGVFLWGWASEQGYFGGDDTMEYQGQSIKLSRKYGSYEAYKDDPNNIDPSENARVQKLVTEAPIAHSFSNRSEMIHAAFEIKFPGYGLGGVPARMSDGSALEVVSIEIPRTEKERYLLFHERGGRYELLDDFVQELPVASIREEHGTLLFLSGDGKELFRRAIAAGQSSHSLE